MTTFRPPSILRTYVCILLYTSHHGKKQNSYQEVRLGIAEPTDKEEKLRKTVTPIQPPRAKAQVARIVKR